MYSTIWIQRQFILHPQYLSNPRDNLHTQIHNLITTCTKEHGSIVDIIDIDWTSLSNIVSRVSGSCIFSVNIHVRCFKPEKGTVVPVQVNKIFPEGVFTVFKGIPMFIPTSEMVGWKYTSDTFYNHETNETIRVGKDMDIEITLVRFNNKVYECIAKIHSI